MSIAAVTSVEKNTRDKGIAQRFMGAKRLERPVAKQNGHLIEMPVGFTYWKLRAICRYVYRDGHDSRAGYVYDDGVRYATEAGVTRETDSSRD